MPLTYDELHQEISAKGVARSGQYYAAKVNSAFLMVSPVGARENERNGWKFHISVAAADIPKAWDLISKHVVDAKLTAKVAAPDVAHEFDDPSDPQRGKTITLYDDRQQQRNWGSILEQIESELSHNNIHSGLDVVGDRKVNGSQYISYRNDLDLEGNYQRADDTYNPYNQPDPFENLHIAALTPEQMRLNKLLHTAQQRYGTEQWQLNQGQGRTGQENLRLSLADETRADELATLLNTAGIPAVRASKQEQQLVMLIKDDSGYNLSDESLTQAETYIAAHQTADALSMLTEHAWQINSGQRHGISHTDVRSTFDSAEEALQLCQQMQQEYGLPVSYKYKEGDDGQMVYMAVMDIKDPETATKQISQVAEHRQAIER